MGDTVITIFTDAELNKILLFSIVLFFYGIISRNGPFSFLVDMKKADIKNSVLEYLPILTS